MTHISSLTLRTSLSHYARLIHVVPRPREYRIGLERLRAWAGKRGGR